MLHANLTLSEKVVNIRTAVNATWCCPIARNFKRLNHFLSNILKKLNVYIYFVIDFTIRLSTENRLRSQRAPKPDKTQSK